MYSMLRKKNQFTPRIVQYKHVEIHLSGLLHVLKYSKKSPNISQEVLIQFLLVFRLGFLTCFRVGFLTCFLVGFLICFLVGFFLGFLVGFFLGFLEPPLRELPPIPSLKLTIDGNLTVRRLVNIGLPSISSKRTRAFRARSWPAAPS